MITAKTAFFNCHFHPKYDVPVWKYQKQSNETKSRGSYGTRKIPRDIHYL